MRGKPSRCVNSEHSPHTSSECILQLSSATVGKHGKKTSVSSSIGQHTVQETKTSARQRSGRSLLGASSPSDHTGVGFPSPGVSVSIYSLMIVAQISEAACTADSSTRALAVKGAAHGGMGKKVGRGGNNAVARV